MNYHLRLRGMVSSWDISRLGGADNVQQIDRNNTRCIRFLPVHDKYVFLGTFNIALGSAPVYITLSFICSFMQSWNREDANLMDGI